MHAYIKRKKEAKKESLKEEAENSRPASAFMSIVMARREKELLENQRNFPNRPDLQGLITEDETKSSSKESKAEVSLIFSSYETYQL